MHVERPFLFVDAVGCVHVVLVDFDRERVELRLGGRVRELRWVGWMRCEDPKAPGQTPETLRLLEEALARRMYGPLTREGAAHAGVDLFGARWEAWITVAGAVVTCDGLEIDGVVWDGASLTHPRSAEPTTDALLRLS